AAERAPLNRPETSAADDRRAPERKIVAIVGRLPGSAGDLIEDDVDLFAGVSHQIHRHRDPAPLGWVLEGIDGLREQRLERLTVGDAGVEIDAVALLVPRLGLHPQ